MYQLEFLTTSEYNYSIYNKKLLAVISTLEDWQYYLKRAAQMFKIWSDYYNL